MGAWNSIHEKLKEFSEMEEENVDESSTPQRVLRHKCLTGVDPRSPTQDVARTPIIVEGTPNVVYTKALKSKITSQGDGPVDPRSPSMEFTRTPLSLGQVSSTLCDTPLKAPVVFTQPPHIGKGDEAKMRLELSGDEEDCDGLEQSATASDSDNDLDIASTTEESLVDSHDTSPLLETMGGLHLSVLGDSKTTGTTALGQETSESEDAPSSLRKPICQPVHRILSQNTNSPSLPKSKGRSPLTQVENSSRVSKLPRKIVASTGVKNNYSPISNAVAVDKENVCH